MMTGTDTRMTNRMSNAITIPATAPGVRPANRKHVCAENTFTKRVEYDCIRRKIWSLLYVKHIRQAATYTNADSGTHTHTHLRQTVAHTLRQIAVNTHN